MDERNSNYEIKISRNGHPVPVINEVHLHSIFNPIKEAEAFALNHEEAIKGNSNYLFLGLGFAYHIDEFIKIAGSYHHEIGILIIEPNKKLIQDYIEEIGADKKDAIIHYETLGDYFADKNLIDFLMLRPSIIKHDASFNVNQDFYKSFLSYKPDQTIKNYINSLRESDYKNYLSTVDNLTFDQLVSNIKGSNRINNKNDFLTLALDEIANNSL